MTANPARTLPYKRSHFATQLPLAYRYTPSHGWLAEIEPGIWRVGLTRFATRMLGDMVDHGIDTEIGASVEPGEILGWIEGFKAIADLYCVAHGEFAGGNPVLKENIGVINKDCYGQGWIYMVKGVPDPRSVDVYGYRAILDHAIDKILEQQKGQEIQ